MYMYAFTVCNLYMYAYISFSLLFDDSILSLSLFSSTKTSQQTGNGFGVTLFLEVFFVAYLPPADSGGDWRGYWPSRGCRRQGYVCIRIRTHTHTRARTYASIYLYLSLYIYLSILYAYAYTSTFVYLEDILYLTYMRI